jgi:hypothetical protein
LPCTKGVAAIIKELYTLSEESTCKTVSCGVMVRVRVKTFWFVARAEAAGGMQKRKTADLT